MLPGIQPFGAATRHQPTRGHSLGRTHSFCALDGAALHVVGGVFCGQLCGGALAGRAAGAEPAPAAGLPDVCAGAAALQL